MCIESHLFGANHPLLYNGGCLSLLFIYHGREEGFEKKKSD